MFYPTTFSWNTALPKTILEPVLTFSPNRNVTKKEKKKSFCVYSILILNTLIEPLIRYQLIRKGQWSRGHQVMWKTFELNQTLLSHLCIFKININQNMYKWQRMALKVHNSCLLIIADFFYKKDYKKTILGTGWQREVNPASQKPQKCVNVDYDIVHSHTHVHTVYI